MTTLFVIGYFIWWLISRTALIQDFFHYAQREELEVRFLHLACLGIFVLPPVAGECVFISKLIATK